MGTWLNGYPVTFWQGNIHTTNLDMATNSTPSRTPPLLDLDAALRRALEPTMYYYYFLPIAIYLLYLVCLLLYVYIFMISSSISNMTTIVVVMRMTIPGP